MLINITNGRIWVKVLVVFISFTICLPCALADEISFITDQEELHFLSPQPLSSTEKTNLAQRDSSNFVLKDLVAGKNMKACPACGGSGRGADVLIRKGYSPTSRAVRNAPKKCPICQGTGTVPDWSDLDTSDPETGGYVLVSLIAGLAIMAYMIKDRNDAVDY